MILKKGLAALSISLLFLSAAAHAQPLGEQTFIPPSSIRSLSDGNGHAGQFTLNPSIDENRPKGVWLAQAQQFSDEQIENTRKNLAETRERLDQRSQALQAEWDALNKEKEEIDRLASGRTLQGSRANKWAKRVRAYNQRMLEYNEKNDKLREDIEAYELAVKNINAAALEASQRQSHTGEQLDALDAELGKIGLSAPSSMDNPEEIERMTDLLEQKRVELEEEYTALQEERQRIINESRQGAGGYGASALTIEQEVYQVNEKINELAEKRKIFNDAVNSVNAILRQNIRPLPEP